MACGLEKICALVKVMQKFYKSLSLGTISAISIFYAFPFFFFFSMLLCQNYFTRIFNTRQQTMTSQLSKHPKTLTSLSFTTFFCFFFFSGFIKSTTFYGTHGMHLFHNLKWMYVEVDDCNSSKKIVSFIKWAVAQNLAVLFLPSHACAVSLTRFYYVHSIILNWPDSFIWKFGMLFSIINLFSVRLSVTIYLLV